MNKILCKISIYETDEYQRFAFADNTWNREYKSHENDSIQKDLVNSIKKYGQITPIQVSRTSNNKFLILDGQHRFLALSKLQMPIKYQISDMSEEYVMEINSTQRSWKNGDAIKFYCNAGNNNYILFKKFIDEIVIIILDLLKETVYIVQDSFLEIF